MSTFEDVLAAFNAPAANLLTAINPAATPTNTPADATAAGAAIIAKLAGGWTLYYFSASDPAWVPPSAVLNASLAICGVMGGGGRGAQGQGGGASTGVIDGGVGGNSGGLLAKAFDPTTLGSTVAILVGTGTATNGANGGVSSFGSILTSAPNANGYSDGGPVWQYVTSAPGKGGKGGGVDGPNFLGFDGTAGGDSAVALGGAGGAGSNGTSGGPGGAGSAGGTGTTASTPVCGGGGGGGGGGRKNSAAGSSATGGAGGPGGYPAAGSGGGGAGQGGNSGSGTGGQGGTTPNGGVFVAVKA